jgi:uncharacterized protein YndB with AHSA1/START domain
MNNRIEKQIELNVPLSRVWQAIADYREFGQWFGVNLEKPFSVNQVTKGKITTPNYEYVKFEAIAQKIQPENYFSYTWHPYAVDLDTDYSEETPTLVEFTLKKTQAGTLFTVAETGFDEIPHHRQEEAFEMHEKGWTEQLQNIKRHLREFEI